MSALRDALYVGGSRAAVRRAVARVEVRPARNNATDWENALLFNEFCLMGFFLFDCRV